MRFGTLLNCSYSPICLVLSGVLMLYTVRGLEDGAGGVSIRVRILLKEEPRRVKTKDGTEHVVVDTSVGDRTGVLTLSLWDKWADEVVAGDTVDIKNGYVNRFKGRLRLNIGRYGSMEKAEDPEFPTVEEITARQEQRRQRRRPT